MPAIQKIKILKGFTATGDLKLSDNGHSNTIRRNNIEWKINPNCGVASMTSIKKKVNSPYVFSALPHPVGSDWEGIISSNAPFTTYEYLIFWKPIGGGDALEYDPKISVLPQIFSFKKKFILFLLAFFGFFSLQRLLKTKK
ncbi:MAG: hypothetical protein LH478_08735 [Chitinophagaceae bacterium]|nr:hypothetical protein [Chitinophagaceae bacterium]